MKKYARIDSGNVVEIFQTPGDITQMFNPELIWLDISSIIPEPQTGWSYDGIVFVAPTITTLVQAQTAQLAVLNAAAANAYVAGFQSSASGALLWYDSDVDTQTVINRQYQIALSNPTVYAATTFFAGATVGTTPIRAKTSQKAADSTKTVQYLTASQMVQLGNDLATAWSTIKAHLWAQQAAVNTATTVTAVEAIVW